MSKCNIVADTLKSIAKDSPFTKHVIMKRPSGLGDALMEEHRVSTMNCIHIRLLQMVKLFEDMEAYGFRSDEERNVLLAFKPALLDASKKVCKIEREYHQRNALKRAHDNKPMTHSQKAVCEMLLSERLPCNAFFEYVMDPEPSRWIVDFALPDKKIAIIIKELHPEITAQVDSKRNWMLMTYGWTVLNFSRSDIMNDPEMVRKTIRKAVTK